MSSSYDTSRICFSICFTFDDTLITTSPIRLLYLILDVVSSPHTHILSFIGSAPMSLGFIVIISLNDLPLLNKLCACDPN